MSVTARCSCRRHRRQEPRSTAAETAAAITFSPVEESQPLWQRGFFDHLVRNTESYAQKWDYVRENPVRAGLVSTAEEWKYQAEIVLIDHA